MKTSLVRQRLRNFEIEKRRKQRLKFLISRNKGESVESLSQQTSNSFISFQQAINEISNFFYACSSNQNGIKKYFIIERMDI